MAIQKINGTKSAIGTDRKEDELICGVIAKFYDRTAVKNIADDFVYAGKHLVMKQYNVLVELDPEFQLQFEEKWTPERHREVKPWGFCRIEPREKALVAGFASSGKSPTQTMALLIPSKAEDTRIACLSEQVSEVHDLFQELLDRVDSIDSRLACFEKHFFNNPGLNLEGFRSGDDEQDDDRDEVHDGPDVQ